MRNIFSWKKRIGVMIPSSNTTMEPELWAMAPKGVSLHFSRMYAVGCSREDLRRQDEDISRCAALLGSAGIDAVLYGCTSGSFVNGLAWERILQQELSRIAGCASITTTGAVLDALRVLGRKKLTIVSPYNDEVSSMEERFFAEQGYQIVSGGHLGLEKGRDIRSCPPETAYNLAKSAITSGTELLFISCTNFRSIELLAPLEQELGIPVISSNQVSLWAALRCVDAVTADSSWGSLFTL